ncbi:hypothetical protein OSB04_007559 [Centaurea solstitialis]|uniref:Phytosulfokine n=1 Tax=Centaurea solstitialis TaxID=347529 RepID=A0AA38WSN0_9ASTR|nr:hypothetical protein OSB04_007559 [Centaurea solstitialis]
MSRATILSFILTLLLSSTLAFATRSMPTTLPNPTITITTTTKYENKGGVKESCEGVGKEECLMRRTLADAHLDYIYTQDKNP